MLFSFLLGYTTTLAEDAVKRKDGDKPAAYRVPPTRAVFSWREHYRLNRYKNNFRRRRHQSWAVSGRSFGLGCRRELLATRVLNQAQQLMKTCLHKRYLLL